MAGLDIAGEEGTPEWPRFIRTTDVLSPRALGAEVVRVSPNDVGGCEVLRQDLLFCRTGSLGTVYFHEASETAAFAGYLVRVRPDPGAVLPEWLAYWADSSHCRQQIARGTIRSTVENFNATKVANLVVPEVSARRQRATVAFLDRASTRISEVCAHTELQLASLEELLREAFTAASGDVDRTIPLRRVIHSIADGPFGRSLASEHYVDSEEIRVIRLGNVGRGEFKFEDRAYVSAAYAKSQLTRHMVAAGDVIIAGLGDPNHPLGRACVVPLRLEPAVHKADCYRVVPDARLCLPQYLALALSYGPSIEVAPLLARGSTRSRLNTMLARELPVPVVAVERQRRVVEEVGVRRSVVHRAADELRGLMRALAEYRDALVTEAVTGKLDVTKVSEQQLDESAHAAMEGERPEVLSA